MEAVGQGTAGQQRKAWRWCGCHGERKKEEEGEEGEEEEGECQERADVAHTILDKSYSL